MGKLSVKDMDRLKEAIDLQRKNCDKEALSILRDLEKRNPENAKVSGFLGLILAKVENRKEAIPHLEKAIGSNSNNELLFLSLYLSYTEIEEYKKSFETLFSYLERHPANLFKDTLEELLEGLIEGYGTTYQDKIIYYAKKNNVPIPEDFL